MSWYLGSDHPSNLICVSKPSSPSLSTKILALALRSEKIQACPWRSRMFVAKQKNKRYFYLSSLKASMGKAFKQCLLSRTCLETNTFAFSSTWRIITFLHCSRQNLLRQNVLRLPGFDPMTWYFADVHSFKFGWGGDLGSGPSGPEFESRCPSKKQPCPEHKAASFNLSIDSLGSKDSNERPNVELALRLL